STLLGEWGAWMVTFGSSGMKVLEDLAGKSFNTQKLAAEAIDEVMLERRHQDLTQHNIEQLRENGDHMTWQLRSLYKQKSSTDEPRSDFTDEQPNDTTDEPLDGPRNTFHNISSDSGAGVKRVNKDISHSQQPSNIVANGTDTSSTSTPLSPPNASLSRSKKRKVLPKFEANIDAVLQIPRATEDAHYGTFNLSSAFRILQLDSAKVVNASSMVELEFIHYFWAVNSIWDLRVPLPDMTDETHSDVFSGFAERYQLKRVSKEDRMLHMDLEDELRATGRISAVRESTTNTTILSIWQRLAENLKSAWHSALDRKGEDTHVHHRLGPFISPTFAAKEFDVVWANKHTAGSQERRAEDGREGYRPDFSIRKHGSVFMIGEAKPPESENNLDEYTSDLYKLIILMKDELDLNIRKGVEDGHCMFGLFLFGYKAELWVLDLDLEGIYHLHLIGECCLPRYQLDTGDVRHFERLLSSVKAHVNKLKFRKQPAGLWTPPRKAQFIRPTIFTPSKKDRAIPSK
ncbi:hypothetical protein BGX29_003074, partial [Mortierella sp. GBA35]